MAEGERADPVPLGLLSDSGAEKSCGDTESDVAQPARLNRKLANTVRCRKCTEKREFRRTNRPYFAKSESWIPAILAICA
jgi:hypothetical protein